MGKPSRLRPQNPPGETRYSYSDGTRKLYDRNKMPDGLDEEIWHLTLLFEQLAENNGQSIIGRPIAYTELSHRIRSSGIRAKHVNWLELIELMMMSYWENERDTQYAVNDFCNVEKFTFYYEWIISEQERNVRLKFGKRVAQIPGESHPDRRSEEEVRASYIMHKKYTEEELEDKFRRFRNK